MAFNPNFRDLDFNNLGYNVGESEDKDPEDEGFLGILRKIAGVSDTKERSDLNPEDRKEYDRKAVSNALMRMGAAMMMHSADPGGFGVALGHGFNALNESSNADLAQALKRSASKRSEDREQRRIENSERNTDANQLNAIANMFNAQQNAVLGQGKLDLGYQQILANYNNAVKANQPQQEDTNSLDYRQKVAKTEKAETDAKIAQVTLEQKYKEITSENNNIDKAKNTNDETLAATTYAEAFTKARKEAPEYASIQAAADAMVKNDTRDSQWDTWLGHLAKYVKDGFRTKDMRSFLEATAFTQVPLFEALGRGKQYFQRITNVDFQALLQASQLEGSSVEAKMLQQYIFNIQQDFGYARNKFVKNLFGTDTTNLERVKAMEDWDQNARSIRPAWTKDGDTLAVDYPRMALNLDTWDKITDRLHDDKSLGDLWQAGMTDDEARTLYSVGTAASDAEASDPRKWQNIVDRAWEADKKLENSAGSNLNKIKQRYVDAIKKQDKENGVEFSQKDAEAVAKSMVEEKIRHMSDTTQDNFANVREKGGLK